MLRNETKVQIQKKMMRLYMSGGPTRLRHWNTEGLTQDQAKQRISELAKARNVEVEFVRSGSAHYILYPDRADGPSESALKTEGIPRKYSAFLQFLQRKPSSTKKASTKKPSAKKPSGQKASTKKMRASMLKKLASCQEKVRSLQAKHQTIATDDKSHEAWIESILRIQILQRESPAEVDDLRLRLAPKSAWTKSVKDKMSGFERDEYVDYLNQDNNLFNYVFTSSNPHFIIVPPGSTATYENTKGVVANSASFLNVVSKLQSEKITGKQR